VQDQYFEFLDFLGVDPNPVTWDIRFTEEERTAQETFFAKLDRPACAVVLGTSKREKNWTVEGYARVLEALDREHGLLPVVVGGPSPIERRIADAVISETGAEVVDMLGDDLRRLMWVLDGSALAISPDTGPLHIARALGKPVVGLFGYTNPKRSGPYRAFEDLIVDGYAEYPGEEYPIMPVYRDGMTRIGVDDVLKKVSLAVDRYVNSEPLSP
jgi:heptosyltransferase I